jgi:hypothetical protein
MTDTNPITIAFHDLGTMLEGKSTFNQFLADEGNAISTDIAKLDAPLQAGATLLFNSLKAGASVLVGAGLTAIGPILSESTDTQATQVLNLLQALGVPTQGPLKPAEQAAVITLINGLKAGLDKIGLGVLTQGVAAPPAA